MSICVLLLWIKQIDEMILENSLIDLASNFPPAPEKKICFEQKSFMMTRSINANQ